MNGVGPRTAATSPTRTRRGLSLSGCEIQPSPRMGTQSVSGAPSVNRSAHGGVSTDRPKAAPSACTPRSRVSNGSMAPTIEPR